METQFKSILSNKLKNKNLTDSSIKLYLKNLERLNDDKPLKNLSFLKNIDSILTKLNKYKDNTRRNYLIAIVSTLQTQQSTKAEKTLYNKYLDLLKNKNSELKKQESNNEMTPQQSKNWISWADVESKHNELKNIVNSFNKKELNEKQWNILLKYMILSLYFYQQPRRNSDYQFMNVIQGNPPNNNINYLSNANKKFIFNKFKTQKQGKQVIDINNNLYDVIKLYLKYHPIINGKINKKTNIPLLVYFDGSSLDKTNSITRLLNSIFKKQIGSSMLRHIFITNKYSDLLKQQKEDAKAMGHSVSMQKDYIKNNSPDGPGYDNEIEV